MAGWSASDPVPAHPGPPEAGLGRSPVADSGGVDRCMYRFFGLTLSSALCFRGLVPLDRPVDPTTTLDMADAVDLERRFGEDTLARGRLRLGDGGAVDLLKNHDGAVLLRYEDRAVFLIAPAGEAVLCAPSDPAALDWQRVLLDTVVGVIALLHGREALHAGAVVLGGRAVAVAAVAGGGKSTLCAELVLRGAPLFADDMVFLESRPDDRLVAFPGPPLMSLSTAWSGDPVALGEVLDVASGEAWIAVRNAARVEAPLRGLVVLDRREGVAGARMTELADPLQLIALALDSGPDPRRRRARFELLAGLAARTPMWRLTADMATPATDLAALVESATARDIS
jgi:hypothetical protein